jgi:hypothetical protein
MSPVKEPAHFSYPENLSRGEAAYLRLFAGAANQSYLGEGSTHYTKRPFMEGVAARIHQFNPDARLVYLMRDPFDRLVSQYRHRVGKHMERRSLVQALKERSDYMAYSYYAYQLKPYVELFGRQAIYLDTFESMAAEPVAFLARLFRWLGIDDSFVPPLAGQRRNVSPVTLEVLDIHSLRGRFWRRLRSHRKLVRLVPAWARRWYKTWVPRSSVRHVDSADFRQEVESARPLVRPLLAEWIGELRELTGRSYQEWPSGKVEGRSEGRCLGTEAVWLPEEILQASRGDRSAAPWARVLPVLSHGSVVLAWSCAAALG